MYEIMIFDGLNDDLIAIRSEVFIDEQKVSYQDEFEGDDEAYIHIGIYDNGKVVGCVRAMKEDDAVYIGRVAVKKSNRKNGIGRMLMNAAEDYGKNIGCKLAHIRAQTQARGFYEKSGYEAYGDTFLEVDIEHIAMKKALV